MPDGHETKWSVQSSSHSFDDWIIIICIVVPPRASTRC